MRHIFYKCFIRKKKLQTEFLFDSRFVNEWNHSVNRRISMSYFRSLGFIFPEKWENIVKLLHISNNIIMEPNGDDDLLIK